MQKKKLFKINTLRAYITLIISLTVATSSISAGIFFYMRTSRTLTANYQETITNQLQQINNQVNEQISNLDSLYQLFMANTTIREYLDPSIDSPEPPKSNDYERKLNIERQMSYLLMNNYLWNKKLIDSVYIFDTAQNTYQLSLSKNDFVDRENNLHVLNSLNSNESSLQIKTLKQDSQTVYFARNIYSIYTGEPIGTIIINVNQNVWRQSYSANTDKNWIIYLYNDEMQILSHKQTSSYLPALLLHNPSHFSDAYAREVSLNNEVFLIEAVEIENGDITSIVAAPKSSIMASLNKTLQAFILIFALIITITLIAAVTLSRLATRPVERMIVYVKKVSKGDKRIAPPTGLYLEYNELTDAFVQMLEKLDVYYKELMEKQLLLKTSEISALQAQMNPHFLFNVLNTIAFKAQMMDNEEIYQMTVSLGELLRSDILSKETDFIPLREELEYIKIYIYLQEMRFEDKITIAIQADPILYDYHIPKFCIQPLIENAIVHGLEPKNGLGKLRLNIIACDKHLEIAVIDNGVGFASDCSDAETVTPSTGNSHTHIGLQNLSKRLKLLYGEQATLNIKSVPNEYTIVSFQIPL